MTLGNSTHPESNLARVFGLCERATPGTWKLPDRERLQGAIVAMIDGRERQVAEASGDAAQFDMRDAACEIQRANAEFIAESRELVPALAAEVKALRAERDRLIEERDRLHDRADVLAIDNKRHERCLADLHERIRFMRDEWSIFGGRPCALCVFDDGIFVRPCQPCKAREQEGKSARRATIARISEWLTTKAEYYKLNQHLGPYSRELAAMLDTDGWLTDTETASIAVTPDVPAEPAEPAEPAPETTAPAWLVLCANCGRDRGSHYDIVGTPGVFCSKYSSLQWKDPTP